MRFREENQIEQNEKFFNNLLNEFENIWEKCFVGRGISKSAAFTAFTQVNQTAEMIHYFTCAEETEDKEEGDEWKTKP